MSVFLKAIEEIESRGWCQHETINSAGNVCALGALAFAVGCKNPRRVEEHWDEFIKAKNTVLNYLPEKGPHVLSVYNDVSTREDIINLFRKVHDLECAQANLTEPSSVPPVS